MTSASLSSKLSPPGSPAAPPNLETLSPTCEDNSMMCTVLNEALQACGGSLRSVEINVKPKIKVPSAFDTCTLGGWNLPSLEHSTLPVTTRHYGFQWDRLVHRGRAVDRSLFRVVAVVVVDSPKKWSQCVSVQLATLVQLMRSRGWSSMVALFLGSVFVVHNEMKYQNRQTISGRRHGWLWSR